MLTTKLSINIVHVIESFGAGTLQVVAAIANFQAENGWNVTVFHGNRHETPADYQEMFDKRVQLIPLRTGRTINGVIDTIDMLRVARFSRMKRVDIIHGHSSKGGVIARCAALLCKSQALYSPHGFSFMVESGADTSRTTFLIEKILAKLPSEITCCSLTEQEAATLLGARNSCIENFVDAKEIYEAVSSTHTLKTIDVVTVGRISDQKNPELFVELAKRFPDKTFYWVGGPIDAVNIGWPENVRITCWLPRKDVINLYAQAKVYLATSRYEGMPIVMLEAMAAGLPIVSTNVPGSKDVIRDGETGYLCETVDHIEQRLNQLLSNNAISAEFSEAARQVVMTHYDRRVVLEKWQDKYQEIITPAKTT
jgi:glycosyltransferase involved in cell wall biosynthesis